MTPLVSWPALDPRAELARLRAESETSLVTVVFKDSPQAPGTPAGARQPHASTAPLQLPLALPLPLSISLPLPDPLSPGSRLLAQLAPLPLPDEERGRALSPTRIAPPPEAAGKATGDAMAQQLQVSVARSGLFYESHLQSWTSGELPLEELRQEPQARLQGPDAPARAEPIVREQLATLESRTAVLPLVLWPGQPATLEIGEEAPQGAAQAGAAPAWKAKLRFESPALGAVELTLQLQGQAVRVAARAADPGAQLAIAGAIPALREALGLRELALQDVTVRHV